MQPTPGLAIKWGFLARGASAGSGAAAFEGALMAGTRLDAPAWIAVSHAKISA